MSSLISQSGWTGGWMDGWTDGWYAEVRGKVQNLSSVCLCF